MAGYQDDYSMSNNAVLARNEDKLPASDFAKRIKKYFPGVAAADIAAALRTEEYHHTSKHYNITFFYSLDQLADCESRAALRAAIAKRKAAEKAAKNMPDIETGCDIKWLEWSGTRNYPVAKERAAENCAIIKGAGKFCTVVCPDGKEMKKGKDTNGFEVKRAGRKVWL